MFANNETHAIRKYGALSAALGLYRSLSAFLGFPLGFSLGFLIQLDRSPASDQSNPLHRKRRLPVLAMFLSMLLPPMLLSACLFRGAI